MAYKTKATCLQSSLLLNFLLSCLFGFTQQNFKSIDLWMKENTGQLGGRAVLVILKNGKIIYDHAENDLTPKQKFIGRMIAKRTGKDEDMMEQDFSSNSQQPIASCSKWLSAALVMTFIDEEKLSLDDSIGKYLPVMTANGKGNIKLWQCLSHLTAIKAPALKESMQENKNIHSMQEAVDRIAVLPMEGEPGKTFHYSSVGLQLVGAVIEKISGKNFETLFAERIARPCNMVHTDFGNNEVALPAGGARSTPNDYIHFLNMILNEGTYNGKRVLSKKSIASMEQNRVGKDCKIVYSPAEAGNWGYGFGEWILGTVPCGERAIAAASPGLFGSFPWIDREKNYAAFLFTLYIKSEGRNKRYLDLKNIVDQALIN